MAATYYYCQKCRALYHRTECEPRGKGRMVHILQRVLSVSGDTHGIEHPVVEE